MRSWRLSLVKQGLSDNTVRRRCGIAKQLFKVAKKRNLVASNPFEELTSTVRGNTKRYYFVTRQEAARVLEACPSWAGAGIALGASILIAEALGMNLPGGAQVIQTLIAVALIVGVAAFLRHQHGHPSPVRVRAKLPESKPDMTRLFRERHLSHAIEKRLNGIKKQSNTERPDRAGNIAQQIRKMLPAEGYLTERMARLRAKAHQIRNGHIARLEETRHVFAKLPASAKKKAAAELAAGYNQIIGVDTRLERLDKAIAENERRIRELTQKAQEHATKYDHKGLVDCLKHAERLQKHNSHLFKSIERTEAKLTALAKQIAARAKQVEKE